jgi:hypothetical protein
VWAHRPREAEARARRDRSRRGGQHCAVGRRHCGGGVGGYTARQGTEGRGQPPVTRGEANKVSRAPERLGWRCMHYMQAQVRVRLGWRSTD